MAKKLCVRKKNDKTQSEKLRERQNARSMISNTVSKIYVI